MKFILALLLTLLSIQAFAVWEVVPPMRNTFSTSSFQTQGFKAPYATPSDICMIGNPTTGLMTVSHIRVSGTQTTGGSAGFFIVKRSSLDTCVENTLTSVGHESRSNSYSDIQWCTGAPTLGTYIGTLRATDVVIPAPGGTSVSGVYDWDFGPNSRVQPMILHQNEMVAVNFAGMAVPTGFQMVCEFTWQEQ